MSNHLKANDQLDLNPSDFDFCEVYVLPITLNLVAFYEKTASFQVFNSTTTGLIFLLRKVIPLLTTYNCRRTCTLCRTTVWV